MLCCYVGYAQYYRAIICCPCHPEYCSLRSLLFVGRLIAWSGQDSKNMAPVLLTQLQRSCFRNYQDGRVVIPEVVCRIHARRYISTFKFRQDLRNS